MIQYLYLFIYRSEITEDLTVTITLEDCTPEDAGEYTVTATNEHGTDTTSAQITVTFEPPMFTKPLSDQIATISETVTLDCEVTGLPQPFTTWLVSGMDISQLSDKYIITSDATRHTLQIDNVTVDDTEMSYTCKAVSPVGEATTEAKLFPQGLLSALCYIVGVLERMVCRSFLLYACLSLTNQLSTTARVRYHHLCPKLVLAS